MKTLFFLVHFFIISSAFCQGQMKTINWNKFIGTAGIDEESIDDVIVDSDGNIVAIGRKTANFGRMILLIKFKPDGTLLLEKLIGNQSQYYRSFRLKEISGKRYMIVGDGNQLVSYIGIFSSTGVTGSFFATQDYDFSDAVEYPDGSIFTAAFSDQHGPALIKLSKNLAILNVYPYDDKGYIDYFSSISATNDGHFYLLGYGYKYDYGHAVVVKISPTGNISWAKRYGAQNLHITPPGPPMATSDAGTGSSNIVSLKQGGFVFAGEGLYVSEDVSTYSTTVVIKADAQGKSLWTKNMFVGGLLGGVRLKPNGNILVFGSMSEGADISPAPNDKYLKAWICELDQNTGAKLWDYSFGGNSSDAVSAMACINNNNCFFVGSTRSRDGIFSSRSRTDDDGWIMSISSISNPTVDLPKLAGAKIYPNPANEFIQLTGSDQTFNDLRMDILNMQGILMSSKTLQKGSLTQEKIATNILPNGAYFLAITTREGWTTLPFVIAR